MSASARSAERSGPVLALTIVLRAISLNAFVTGGLCLIFGPDLLSAGGDVAPNLAQEFRFLSVWWIAAGIYLWSLGSRAALAVGELRVVCAALFVSGIARWTSFATHGWPDAFFVVIAVIELLAPLPLLWLQQAHVRGLRRAMA